MSCAKFMQKGLCGKYQRNMWKRTFEERNGELFVLTKNFCNKTYLERK